jgi:hypothetical protein
MGPVRLIDENGAYIDAGNPLPVTPAGLVTGSTVHSTAYEASHVLKASAGKLMSLTVYNSNASAQFIQVHDAASLPADSTVPVLVLSVPGLTTAVFDIPATGLPCSTGIVVCNSSTGPTKTIGSADCFFTGVVV